MPKKTATTTSETQKVSSYAFSQTTLDILHQLDSTYSESN